ncbi:hypothetical protein C8Q77DRAFT_1204849 [Trametes polyzona]|nr:hypothetical protein C8Q77DRAFT_1204849 [Trametes polyzona]
MYIRSEPTTPGCPPDYPLCEPSLSVGPALPDTDTVAADPEDSPASRSSTSISSLTLPSSSSESIFLPSLTGTAGPESTSTADPQLQAADAAAAAAGGTDPIQRLGRRNFIGIVVLSVLVFAGLVLWLSFGRWPRAGFARLGLGRRGGDKRRAKRDDAAPGSGSGSEASCGGCGCGDGDGAVCGEEACPGPAAAGSDPSRRRSRALDLDRDLHGGGTRAQDENEKGGGEAAMVTPCSPLSVDEEVVVDSLEKDAEPAADPSATRRGPRVRFA